MTQCRPGDLALCIGGSSLGALCHVERPEPHPLTPEPAWLCRVLGHATVMRNIKGEWVRDIPAPPGALVIFLDRHLKPLRPPPEKLPAPPQEVEQHAT